MEHADICELEDEKSIILNLKDRFKKSIIYTYLARVLIAINPYKNINGLYSEEMVKSYQRDFHDDLPPHLYSIANKIVQRIGPERPQTIILTGVSGSGKTRSAANILTYLGNSSLSDHTKQRILSTNSIFEYFGNAATCLNGDSSRFSKLTEMQFYPDLKLASVNFSYLLLESSRVYSRNENETNFHIFYSMLSAPPDLELNLHINKKYAYLLDNRGYNHSKNVVKFEAVDKSLHNVGLSKNDRMRIFKILAAILHLGNIELEENTDGKCQISDSSTGHFENAARLLEIDQKRLRAALFTRIITVGDSNPIIIELSLSRAIKVKQTLSKILYEHVFQYVVNLTNEIGLTNFSGLHLNMLDIAGYECFGKSNHFEQLAINYINEKIQQMFTKIMLKDEKEWYAKECLDVPEIPFFDNAPILDIFENKSNGIFKILDDTCKIQCQNSINFTEKILSSWPNNSILIPLKPKDLQERDFSGFVIQHFAGQVLYNADNFVEKNMDIAPKDIADFCQNLCTSKINDKSATYQLKMGVQNLISKLDKTECSFIRCIKPNEKQCADIFDDELILTQLISTSSIAYQQLMRKGYPSHMRIDSLIDRFKENQEFHMFISINNKDFCSTLIRSCSLNWCDFRLGNNNIFFRNGKDLTFTEKLKDDLKIIIGRYKNLISIRAKWRVLHAVARLCTIGIKRRKEVNAINLAVDPSVNAKTSLQVEKENSKISKKRKKLDLASSHSVREQKNKNRRTTITIPSKENRTPEIISTENQLRNLLHLEQQKNAQLNSDYRNLQERNLNVISSYNDMKKENQRLIEENARLQTDNRTMPPNK